MLDTLEDAMHETATKEILASESLIFTGNAHPEFAEQLSQLLDLRLVACQIEHFADGETLARLCEPVPRKNVILVQPLAPPVNESLVELLLLSDACRRAGATRITAVVPYLGYGRGDKRNGNSESVACRLVLDFMQCAGIDEVLVVDPHSPQIEGFTTMPLHVLSAVPLLCEAMRPFMPDDIVVISPDVGRAKTAQQFGLRLGAPVLVLDKTRPLAEQVGPDTSRGGLLCRPSLIVDDMISTGRTLNATILGLLSLRARPDFRIAATHGLFLRQARQTLSHPSIRKLFVTDTVKSSNIDWAELHVIPITSLVADALKPLLV
jgi:ribose-phosphate pyrophosphokinase